MNDKTKFVIEVYHDGVVIPFHMRGRDRYLKEKEFLAQLTDFASMSVLRPVPDPITDTYIMTDDQLDRYCDFRRSLEGKPPKAR